MAGTRRYRKPLVSYEFGTRIYAPSEGEDRYRIVTTDADGRRVFQKVTNEETARRRARQLEKMLASSVTMPGRLQAPTTVGGLIDRYVASLGSRSNRYAERQEYLLRMWVRPVLGERALADWTPSDSEVVLDRARRSLAPSTVQNVGSTMRAMVTFAFKNRWLAREADPMWLVRYSPSTEIQGSGDRLHRSFVATHRRRVRPPLRGTGGCRPPGMGAGHAAQAPERCPLG